MKRWEGEKGEGADNFDDDYDMAQSVRGRDGKEKKRRVGMGKS